MRKYKKYTPENTWNEHSWGRYGHAYGSWYRKPRTFNERRQNTGAIADGIPVRRRKLPTSWDDIPYSQSYGRDWKRFTKRKHQYERPPRK